MVKYGILELRFQCPLVMLSDQCYFVIIMINDSLSVISMKISKSS